MTRLLAISGSLRRQSYNTMLLHAAEALCGPEVSFVFWSGLAAIPAFDEDLDQVPPSVGALKEAIASADAVLIATPEYNASVPGALKNALDWVSRPLETNPLREKAVAVVAASQGVFGAVWAAGELRKILRTLGARVDNAELVVPHAQDAFTPDGSLRDTGQVAALAAVVDSLARRAYRRAA